MQQEEDGTVSPPEYLEDTPLKELEGLQTDIETDTDSDTPLPSPVVASSPPPPKTQLSATVVIPVWILLSSTVIIYNNYLFNTLNFKYPVFLVTWHLTFAVRWAQFDA